MCIIIHQDEHHVIRNPSCAEPEKIIVTGILPDFSEGHCPQDQAAKNGQKCADRGPEPLIFNGDFERHATCLTAGLGVEF